MFVKLLMLIRQMGLINALFVTIGIFWIFSSIAILNVNGINYRCIIGGIAKNEAKILFKRMLICVNKVAYHKISSSSYIRRIKKL